jgi:integrase
VFSTLLVSSGMRFCEAIGLQSADFDFEAGILEVARSVVKVSREHHPQGKTFLARDYTKNGQTRRLKARRSCGRARTGICGGARHRRDGGDVPGGAGGSAAAHQARLTEEEIRALGDCEPVAGRVYVNGTLGGHVQAKCRCAGCRQWARDYGRERMRVRRATASSSEVRRRWEKSRDADESYLDEPIWNRIWARAVADSGIPFKPTAYQVRHTHASWLIDAGENPKAVMHRLGQADLRTTARYVHVLDEPGSQLPSGSKGSDLRKAWLVWC